MTQLVELQQQLPLLDGIAVYAISYDSVSALAEFAARERVTFSLLSDEGSAVITELGLRNEHVFEHHAVHGFAPDDKYLGVPYPGIFTLSAEGTIVDKVFHQSYRERDTGPGIAARSLGIDTATGPHSTADAGAVTVRCSLDAAEWKPAQRLWLSVEWAIAPGHHVYAWPAPGGLQGASIEFVDSADLRAGSPKWPPVGTMFDVGLNSQVGVFEGIVRAAVPLTITAPKGTGDIEVNGRVRFQVCTATTCLMPGQVPFTLPIAEGRFVRPARR